MCIWLIPNILKEPADFLFELDNSKYSPCPPSGFLNGALNLTQHQKEIAQDKYVAWNQELTHEVALNAADDAFLKKNATDIEIYSFIDCQLVNVTKG